MTPSAKVQKRRQVQVFEELQGILGEDTATVRAREQSTFDRILAERGGRCVLFGAGSLGRTALACLRRDGIEPLAFADNNPRIWNTEVEGIRVLPPDTAATVYAANAAFFVTIWSLRHRYAETQAQLNFLGAPWVYPAAPLRWKYSAELLPFFCQDLPHKVYEEAEAVLAAFGLWSDDLSRDEYLRQIRYRALGDYECLAAPDPEPSYFLDSLYSLGPDEVFVDCGAYDGDTIREIVRRGGRAFSRILALEPDPVNFAALEKYVASLPPQLAARIKSYPYAVSDRSGQLRFSATGDMVSAISATGDFLIDARALDDLPLGKAPTFVKMDIEGHEVDALKGSRKLIARHHPILSVCLYHRQSDLWRIPLLIHSFYPGYRYYLRSHEEDGWQTVGYAVPPERLNDAAADPARERRVRAQLLRADGGQ